jgi:hypothetical protein
MRRKVTCTLTNEVGWTAALLVARLDLADVVLLGASPEAAADLAAAGEVLGSGPRVTAGGWEEAAGSDVVLLAEAATDAGLEVRRRCSGSVVIVATETPAEDVARLLGETLLPRGRLIGVPGGGPYERAARAVALADSVLRDRGDREHRGAVLCRGDEDDVQERTVRIGAAGVVEIVQPAAYDAQPR